jgi:hypothetical protein
VNSMRLSAGSGTLILQYLKPPELRNLTSPCEIAGRVFAATRLKLSRQHFALGNTTCPFRKFHPGWDSRHGQIIELIGFDASNPAFARNVSSTCSSRGARLKPKTYFFAISSTSP